MALSAEDEELLRMEAEIKRMEEEVTRFPPVSRLKPLILAHSLFLFLSASLALCFFLDTL